MFSLGAGAHLVPAAAAVAAGSYANLRRAATTTRRASESAFKTSKRLPRHVARAMGDDPDDAEVAAAAAAADAAAAAAAAVPAVEEVLPGEIDSRWQTIVKHASRAVVVIKTTGVRAFDTESAGVGKSFCIPLGVKGFRLRVSGCALRVAS